MQNTINQDVDDVWREQMRKRIRNKQQLRLKEAQNELQKLKEQQAVLRKEVLKSLTGESVYETDMLKKMLSDNKESCDAVEAVLHDCQKEKDNEELRIQHLMEQYAAVADWKSVFFDAPDDVKKMILARLIRKITVDKEYHLTIDFFISSDEFEYNINNGQNNVRAEQSTTFIEFVAM